MLLSPVLLPLFPLLLLLTTSPARGQGYIGGCVLAEGDPSLVPGNNVYAISDLVAEESCSPFTKVMNVYGIGLFTNTGGQTIPENAVKWVAHAVTEMFPSTASDLNAQQAVVTAMYRYKASVPLFYPRFVDEMEPARDYLSICD